MRRKDRRTAVELIADRLKEKGVKIDCIRQPVPPEPGFVTFFDPSLPSHLLKIKVIERFLDLQDEYVERIAESLRELERERAMHDEQLLSPEEETGSGDQRGGDSDTGSG